MSIGGATNATLALSTGRICATTLGMPLTSGCLNRNRMNATMCSSCITLARATVRPGVTTLVSLGSNGTASNGFRYSRATARCRFSTGCRSTRTTSPSFARTCGGPVSLLSVIANYCVSGSRTGRVAGRALGTTNLRFHFTLPAGPCAMNSGSASRRGFTDMTGASNT